MSDRDFRGITEETAHDIGYSRCKFSTRLPRRYQYTGAHFWIAPQPEAGLLRVGFTKFASRMLGELVEMGLDVKAGDPISTGKEIGWFEGLKAVTNIYCVVDGEFVRPNPDLVGNEKWTRTDPYGKGWIYEARGTPDPKAFDAFGYIEFLNATIDKMQED